MPKYKFFLLFAFGFAFGFALAMCIGIYRQEKVASEASKQIAVASNVIADLQNKQKELDSLKITIRDERILCDEDRYNFQSEIQELQERVDGSEQECPVCPVCHAVRNTRQSDEIIIRESKN